MKFLIFFLLLFFFIPFKAEESTQVVVNIKEQQKVSPLTEVKSFRKESTSTIAEVITSVAEKYNIDPVQFLTVAKCESRLLPTAVGDDGTSFGIWQIHIPDHTTVTVAMAEDVQLSTEWAAQLWLESPDNWTCYRRIYGTKSGTI